MREVNKRTNGVGNIAYSFQPETRLDWSLILARTHFRRTGGSGTDIADLVLSLDPKLGRDENTDDYKQALWTWRNAGVGADAEFWVPDHSIKAYTFGPDDYLSLAWTNPDADEIRWGIWFRVLYKD